MPGLYTNQLDNPAFRPSDFGFPDSLAARLRPATAKDQHNGGDQIKHCHICLDNFTSTNPDEPTCSAANKLSCGHIFGRRCILEHLARRLGPPTCPMCRQRCKRFERTSQTQYHSVNNTDDVAFSDLEAERLFTAVVGPSSAGNGATEGLSLAGLSPDVRQLVTAMERELMEALEAADLVTRQLERLRRLD